MLFLNLLSIGARGHTEHLFSDPLNSLFLCFLTPILLNWKRLLGFGGPDLNMIFFFQWKSSPRAAPFQAIAQGIYFHLIALPSEHTTFDFGGRKRTGGFLMCHFHSWFIRTSHTAPTYPKGRPGKCGVLYAKGGKSCFKLQSHKKLKHRGFFEII